MRPSKIRPVFTYLEFLKIKESARRWNGRDLNDKHDIKLIYEMINWAIERKKLKYNNDYTDTKNKMERWQREYWVYSLDTSEYYHRVFSADYPFARIIDLIDQGVVYVKSEGDYTLEEDILSRLRLKDGVRKLIEEFDLQLSL